MRYQDSTGDLNYLLQAKIHPYEEIMRGIMKRKIDAQQRSRMMAAVKKKNTRAEIAVRSVLHRHGLRFSLHDRKLPGTPDIVLRARHVVVFVHGCYWHRCPHCRVGKVTPQANLSYWIPKFKRNQRRDVEVKKTLLHQGWRVFVVWECQISNRELLERLAKKIRQPFAKAAQS
jgi:DNA mismatch endonuclease, patch repair protein